MTIHDLEDSLRAMGDVPHALGVSDAKALGLRHDLAGDPLTAFAERIGCEVSGPYWSACEEDNYYVFVKLKVPADVQPLLPYT